MGRSEPSDDTAIRLTNWVSLIIGFSTGLFLMLVAHNAALNGVAISVHGLLGVIGGYIGTWLMLIAAVILLSLASGIALGLILLLSLLLFLSVIVAVLG